MTDDKGSIRWSALYGVGIFPPTADAPCRMCVESLAEEIEAACLLDPELAASLLPREPTDWRAIARLGRVNLCEPHLAALRRTLSEG